MDQNIVLNGNKLIAEFLGIKIDSEDFNFVPKNIFTHSIEADIQISDLYELEFHSSWDWLMPVVEKIESIYDDFHGYFAVHIVSNGCTISGTKLRPGVVNAYFNQEYADSKLKATYECVVKFIKWYNEYKN